MEKDTVLLSLKKYMGLVNFKKQIIAENSYCIYEYYSYGRNEINTFYTKDETIRKFSNHIKELYKKIDTLKKELYPDKKKTTIQDLKKMSVWQFLKWKNK